MRPLQYPTLLNLDDLKLRLFQTLRLTSLFRKLILFAIDSLIVLSALWLSICIRLGEWFDIQLYFETSAGIFGLLLWHVSANLFSYYRGVFRYFGYYDQRQIGAICAFILIWSVALFGFVTIEQVPRTVSVIFPLILGLLIVIERRVYSHFFEVAVLNKVFAKQFPSSSHKVGALVLGTGPMSQKVLQILSVDEGIAVRGFIDSDNAMNGRRLLGCDVFSLKRVKTLDLFNQFKLLCVPEDLIGSELLKQVQVTSKSKGVAIEIISALDSSSVKKRSVEITDVIQRNVYEVSQQDLAYLKDQSVLIFGAGGSIGSQLSQQVALANPQRLILVDQSEYGLFEIQRNISARYPTVDLTIILADACNLQRLEMIFKRFMPSIVFQAAAYKHVSIVEHNVIEGLRNNIESTWFTLRLSELYGVSRFILISSDKAVRPTNVMGASKRICEKIILGRRDGGKDLLTGAVRFGNVLGSSGSVIPIFEQQIEMGGPVTVTHPEVERYFMSIPEAASLVIAAGSMVEDGSLFVLDMGERVRVLDVANTMIAMSNGRKTISADIEIKFTGLRPGEKMIEELTISDKAVPTRNPLIYQEKGSSEKVGLNDSHVENLLAELAEIKDSESLSTWIKKYVPEYDASNSLLDIELSSKSHLF